MHPRAVTRRTGAAAAFGIASLAAAIAAAFGAGLLLLPGIPAATVIGYLLGPTVRLHGSNLSAALKMSFFTVLVGDLMIVLAMGIGVVVLDVTATEFNPVKLVGELVGLWAIGLLLYGLPTLAFVVGPCTIAWVLLVTWLARRSADNGTR
jgi:uncharacterized membrane protein YesL